MTSTPITVKCTFEPLSDFVPTQGLSDF